MPEHDYEYALWEIRRRLHDPRGRKAAVMVGAGFSRNARHRSEQQQVFNDWLNTLENVVLLDSEASSEQRNRANGLIIKAQQAGWCVTQAVAIRVFCGYLPVDEAVSVIRISLGDREAISVRQACDAIVWWHELGQTRGLTLPSELSQILAALVVERRHDNLP